MEVASNQEYFANQKAALGSENQPADSLLGRAIAIIRKAMHLADSEGSNYSLNRMDYSVASAPSPENSQAYQASSQSHQPENNTSLSPEIIAEYTRYLYQGGILIKKGLYAEAIQHFHNGQELAKVGWRIPRARELLLSEIPKPEEFASISDTIAENSWCLNGNTIKLSGLRVYKVSQSNEPEEIKTPLPPALLHEIALICMEEWIHVLQKLRGKNLSNFRDDETDVAEYLRRNGIPLTQAFLARYNRHQDLQRVG